MSGNTLYGTASPGGAGGNGVVFSLNASGANFTTLHSFSPIDTLSATNTDRAMPLGGLVLSNGTLYGTTYAGDLGGRGAIFSIQTNGLGFTVLHHFAAVDSIAATNTDGASPCATLMLSSNVLYGTASGGGTGAAGTVFALNLASLQFTTIHSFAAVAANGTNNDGAFPVAPVIRVGNSLYGTTFSGGPGAAGTVFSLPVPTPPAVITNVVRNLDGTVKLYFLGGPNSTNIIQAATRLTPTLAWQNVSTNLADANGAWQFTGSNNTATRFYRDVLNQNGARYLIVFEGVNDIGGVSDANAPMLTTNLINAYTQFANKAKADGLRAYGATITPFGGNGYYTSAHETTRQSVNAWFRTNTIFDGVIDFDAAVRDPADPTKFKAEYFPGTNANDWLHMNPLGYLAIAEAIDLNLFTP